MPARPDKHVTVSRQEYNALMDIRGLPEAAHHMMMTADLLSEGNWQLIGKKAAFQELLETIIEEIEEEMAPRKNRKTLVTLCNRLASPNNPYELKKILS